jgi:leucyl aminopeptidase (aminopeptidase T)
MRSRAVQAAFAALLATSLSPRAGAVEKPDLRKAAARIVESAAIREGDLVVVLGDLAMIDLLEEISVAVAARGGHPMQLVGRERTGLRYYTEVPEKYDATRAAFWLKVTEIADAVIRVEWNDAPGLYRKVPAARFAAVTQSFQPAAQTLLRRGVRDVYVGNALMPTGSTARMLGLSRPELARVFWNALATDPARIQANGAAVKAALAGGKQVRVTHRNGTDLRFGIEGRQVILSDGAITPERVAQGGAATLLYLPAGEAQVAAVPGTAEGVVVFDRLPTVNGNIEKLRWTFQGGKLVSRDAKPGPAFAREGDLRGRRSRQGRLRRHRLRPSPRGARAGRENAAELHSRWVGQPRYRRRHDDGRQQRLGVLGLRVPPRGDGGGGRKGDRRQGRAEGRALGSRHSARVAIGAEIDPGECPVGPDPGGPDPE